MQIDKENKKISMSREINASQEKIWQAYTQPELIAKWWGPRKYETIVEKFDFKEGGEWRMINRGAEGDFVFFGTFSEINPMEKFTWTFSFEGMPGKALVETMTFEKINENKTKVTSTGVYDTVEDLEGMVNSGMEQGAMESWDRLEETFR